MKSLLPSPPSGPPLSVYHFLRIPWPAYPVFSRCLQKGISCRVPDLKGPNQTQNMGIDGEIKDPGNKSWKKKEHKASFTMKQYMKPEEGLGGGERALLDIYIKHCITSINTHTTQKQGKPNKLYDTYGICFLTVKVNRSLEWAVIRAAGPAPCIWQQPVTPCCFSGPLDRASPSRPGKSLKVTRQTRVCERVPMGAF